MQTTRRTVMGALIGAPFAALTSRYADAKDAYPARPVQCVVPFPPGGATDVNGRIISAALGKALGQPLVIENLAGASGVMGTAHVARAKPDGYTLVVGNVSTHAIAPGLIAKLPYAPLRDFEPIAHTGKLVDLLVVHPSLGIKSVKDLVAYAKAKPEALTFGSAGIGGTPHLSGELFKLRTGTSIQHVPYRGGGPMLTDLLAGHISMAFGNVPDLVPHIKEGRLTVLGVTSRTRWPGLPDIPTLEEQGVPNYEVLSWIGLFAPVGIPADVKDRLVRETVAIQRQPEVVDGLSKQNFVLDPIGGEDFRKYVASQIAFWGAFLKQTGIKADL